MSLFDLSADDVFSSPVLDGTGTAGVNGETANDVSWTDRIFKTGTDFVSQFLDYQAKKRLAEEEYKYQLAANQQQQMLALPELTQNVGATPQPIFTPSSSGGGMNGNALLIGALVLAAVVLVK